MCRSDRSKYVDRFLVLFYRKEKSTVEQGSHGFVEHLDDTQNPLSLGGIRVEEILIMV